MSTPLDLSYMDWRNSLDDRQRKELEFAELYARSFNHGTDGHSRLVLIARLALMLDEGFKQVSGPQSEPPPSVSDVPPVETNPQAVSLDAPRSDPTIEQT